MGATILFFSEGSFAPHKKLWCKSEFAQIVRERLVPYCLGLANRNRNQTSDANDENNKIG